MDLINWHCDYFAPIFHRTVFIVATNDNSILKLLFKGLKNLIRLIHDKNDNGNDDDVDDDADDDDDDDNNNKKRTWQEN